jgi:hypothetical protein
MRTDRSLSWFGGAVFGVMVAATGCGGGDDGGGDDDGTQPEAGSGGGGGASGAAGKGSGGKGGSAGTATGGGGTAGTGRSEAGAGGDDGDTGGTAGDPAGGGAGTGVGGSGAEAGVGGSGGDGSGPTSCSASNCCLADGSVCIDVPDGVHVTVTSSTADPNLGTGVTVAADPFDVDFLHDPTDPVTVVATIDEGVDPQVVVVVHVDADGNQTDVDATVDGNEATVSVDADGTYVVGVIDTTPPDGCTVNEVAASVQVRSDLEADLIDGVTRIDGDLSISGGTTNLEALRCLTHVTGNVTVANPSVLTTLPLPALAVVGGSVSVTSAPRLTSIALPQLRKLGMDEVASITFSTLPELIAIDFRRLAHAPGAIAMAPLGKLRVEPLTMAFSKLATVNGDFSFSTTTAVIDSFGALRHVGGSVTLAAYGDSLSGFTALETIGGALSVDGLYAEVIRFDALRNVGSVDQGGFEELSVGVYGSPYLRELGLPLLTHTAGGVWISAGGTGTELSLDLAFEEVGASLSIDNNGEEASLEGLTALRSVAGELRLLGPFAAAELPLLTSVSTSVYVDSPTLQTFNAPALATIGAGITIKGADALAEIGLGALTSLNEGGVATFGADVTAAPILETFDLSSLGEIGGDVQILGLGNGSLVVDLGSLQRVRGDLAVEALEGTRFDTSALTTVDGNLLLWSNLVPVELSQLEVVGGRILVEDHQTMTHLDLSGLTSVGGEDGFLLGSVGLNGLPVLEHVDLSKLASMPSNFRITWVGYETAQPLTLDLAALTQVGGDVEITQAMTLSNVDAFSNVDSIGGDVHLFENDALTSLDGFMGLTSLGGNLSIQTNAQLPTCEAESLATYVGGITFDGTVTIAGNLADACN